MPSCVRFRQQRRTGALTDMLRRDPVNHVTAAVSDRELGLAVVLLGVVLVLATILVPLVSWRLSHRLGAAQPA